MTSYSFYPTAATTLNSTGEAEAITNMYIDRLRDIDKYLDFIAVWEREDDTCRVDKKVVDKFARIESLRQRISEGTLFHNWAQITDSMKMLASINDKAAPLEIDVDRQLVSHAQVLAINFASLAHKAKQSSNGDGDISFSTQVLLIKSCTPRKWWWIFKAAARGFEVDLESDTGKLPKRVQPRRRLPWLSQLPESGQAGESPAQKGKRSLSEEVEAKAQAVERPTKRRRSNNDASQLSRRPQKGLPSMVFWKPPSASNMAASKRASPRVLLRPTAASHLAARRAASRTEAANKANRDSPLHEKEVSDTGAETDILSDLPRDFPPFSPLEHIHGSTTPLVIADSQPDDAISPSFPTSSVNTSDTTTLLGDNDEEEGDLKRETQVLDDLSNDEFLAYAVARTAQAEHALDLLEG